MIADNNGDILQDGVAITTYADHADRPANVDKVNAAIKLHQKGKHATEEQLGAVVEQLMAQSGLGIDAELATRMIGWITDRQAAE